jgi:hypothetical protein
MLHLVMATSIHMKLYVQFSSVYLNPKYLTDSNIKHITNTGT